MEIKSMRNENGYSIFELMTVIGIIAIIASIAVPNILRWRSNSQLSRATQDLYSNFQSTKIQAVRSNTVCTIAFDTAAGNYKAFVDDDQDLTLDAGEQVIRTVNWSEYPGVSLNTALGGGDGLNLSNPNNAIAFAPNGFCVNNTGALAAGTVFLRNNNKQTQIDVTPTGSVSIN
jgi:prepilin-type N-terminal cleavage/methylation domain-containing protein